MQVKIRIAMVANVPRLLVEGAPNSEYAGGFHEFGNSLSPFFVLHVILYSIPESQTRSLLIISTLIILDLDLVER